MKRSSFRPQLPPRPDRSDEFASHKTAPTKAVMVANLDARMSVPAPKTRAFRSKALLEACRELPCQVCGVQDGTVCAAHANWSSYGKGMSRKADDSAVAALCSVCHSDLDQGARMTKADRRAMWEEAHRKTVEALRMNERHE